MSPRKNRRTGFTLVEVLIVITIIVILGLAILLTLNPLTQIFKGYDTRRRSDLDLLETTFENYYADHGSYPSPTVLEQCDSPGLQPYLNSIPCDPTTKKPYKSYFVSGPSENQSLPQQYAIYASIEAPGNDPAVNQIHNCPQTIAVHSPGMSNANLIKGCSGITICPNYYGCQSGVCVLVSQDLPPSCQPNSCDADCGGVDCGKKVDDVFTNECVAF